MSGLNVLSLFDGMSCGQIALDKLGVKVNSYYSSEVDKYAIKITQKNYPNTIQLGDVRELSSDYLKSLDIDLMIGGSPCQNLSFTVINNQEHNKGLDGEKSKLFYEYVRILRAINPKFFLLENVFSMRDEDRDIITSALGVEPIMINSALFSAQERRRYYWTNIPQYPINTNKGLVLIDIIQCASEVDKKYWYKQSFDYHGGNERVVATLHINGHDILKRVYNKNAKCATLTAVSGGHHQKKVFQNGACRKLTPKEYERLQTVPDDYTKGVSDTQRYSMLGNGWTVAVIKHIFKHLKAE